MSVLRALLLAASQNPWLKENFPKYRFAQRAVRRFMPGEDATSALSVSRALQPDGIPIVVTYLGENIANSAAAAEVAAHYMGVLDQIAATAQGTEVSVKLTQLGHDLSHAESLDHVRKLAAQASARNNALWIDMEDSKYTDSTLALYRQVKAEFPNVGLCLQAYLYRTANDLQSLMPLRPAIRLVKGAYREPPDRAFPKKTDVDANFFQLAETLLIAARAGEARAVFATHDTALIARICQRAEQLQVPKERFEFQMLYGIRTVLLRGLVRDGHVGRVLVSYGPAWFPWYMRRLAERPANLWFVLKNLISN